MENDSLAMRRETNISKNLIKQLQKMQSPNIQCVKSTAGT